MNSVNQTIGGLALREYSNVRLIGYRTPHAIERKRLIVGNDNIDIGHTPHPAVCVGMKPASFTSKDLGTVGSKAIRDDRTDWLTANCS